MTNSSHSIQPDTPRKAPPSVPPHPGDLKQLQRRLPFLSPTEAVRQARAAVRCQPSSPLAWTLLGTLLRKTGDLAGMAQAMTAALVLDPGTVHRYTNLGVAWTFLGRSQGADHLISRALQLDPRCVDALEQRGRFLMERRQYDEAVPVLTQVVALAPHRDMGYAALGLALIEVDRPQDAVRMCRWAVRLAPRRATAHLNLGRALQAVRQRDAARLAFEMALRLQPTMAAAHFNLGTFFQNAEQFEQAQHHFTMALVCDPGLAKAYAGLGVVLLLQERVEAGIATLKRAETLAPTAVDVWQVHLNMLDSRNDQDGVSDTLQRAITACGSHPVLSVIQARSLMKAGALETARAVLDWGPETANVTVDASRGRAFVLGHILDRLGDVPGAFAAFQKANEIAASLPDFQGADQERNCQQVQALADWVRAGSVTPPPRRDDPQPHRDPVFLVGFPRSGTTLMDTILMSHSSVVMLEEKSTVDNVIKAQWGAGKLEFRSLNKIGPKRAAFLREIYFETAQNCAGYLPKDSVLIDKNPLNIKYLPLLYKLFPQATVIFALRHPCDCVLSCFMQDFSPTRTLAQFLTLDQSARYYDAIMRAWTACRESLPLRVHVVRYESLVTDFEPTARSLLEALDLPWDDRIRDYQRTARARGVISTPSYDQVIQPLYTKAIGRWRRYHEAMAPVLPVLRPWIDAFGYGDDAADGV